MSDRLQALIRRCAVAGLALVAAVQACAATGTASESFRARLPQDEIVYVLMPDRFDNADPANDRGGLAGGRLSTGFDATDKSFYEGGDLKGVLQRLDYIAGLGVTAIWLTPVLRNQAVQGRAGHESSGYHGYWITDFTAIDPHLGTRADYKALVDAAHARGIKVYFDIVINHTADVIKYRECPANDCVYRSRADYPYQRRDGIGGAAINPGFDGRDFGRLTRPDYAYTPYFPAGLEHAKKPDWLNDPILYHNRGESTFRNESSLDGDFVGLDDVMTEHPRVVAGFIEIYGRWIDEFGLDGFRIDTARHVNPEFWQAFVPAMQARARSRGIPNFTVFGEVMDTDPAVLARFTRVDRYPVVEDFGFQAAVADVVAKSAGTARLARLFDADADYEGGAAAALALPTFTGNYDIGRFAWMVRDANPKAGDDEVLARVELSNAMLMLLRGVPVIYAGDEQGFAGIGNDQSARAPMFANAVPEYLADRRLGTMATAATASFDTAHPLYRQLAGLARLRAADPALRRGLQTVRAAEDKAGLFAVSRRVPGSTAETLLVFNTSAEPITAQVEVDARSARWTGSGCAPTASAPGSYRVSVEAFKWLVCRAG